MRLVGQTRGVLDDQSHWTRWCTWPRALSLLLAEDQHPSAPLCPIWAFPRTTGSNLGLSQSILPAARERQLRWGGGMGWVSGGPGEVLALTGTHRRSLGHLVPSLRLDFFYHLFLNFLLWKSLSLYKSRENSRMSHHVPVNQLQWLATHGQSCLISTHPS